ncbi:DNA-binding response regulator [Bdellovibrio sp. ZAP7]|uniref:response regulator transcription factor n=1 Tax=Bdellovibrio sp. ZAP7 TaxID=2231053 RepID=UPI001158F063|nr:response regulator transcription factor [Bdellovibrio sp. ZAP7]QDK46709.1 DNA-binding response regulator [Bdellovibrio sp. ZAP7]
MKFLILEDDLEISRIISHAMRDLGAECDVESSASQAICKLKANCYDLIILDVSLQEGDGISFLKTVRLQESQIPIIIVSGQNSIEDRINGLGMGADDYLSKPFSILELQMRIRGLLRHTIPPQHILEFKNLKLCRIKRDVYVNGVRAHLQFLEYKLLDLFMSHPHKIINKNTIMRAVWAMDITPKTNVIDVLVCRLRSKIENSEGDRKLFTVRGVGYVFRPDSDGSNDVSNLRPQESQHALSSLWP